MTTPNTPMPELSDLIALFYPTQGELGEFHEVRGADMPEDYRTLLDHHAHMTVTVERFHESLVDVEVLQSIHQQDDNVYARKILLRRQSDGEVVQYGIVRLHMDYLATDVQGEILSQATPLGRILIQHNVLREVQLVSLWEVLANEELRELFKKPPGAIVYGRTALIYCNGEAAVELLEIVSV